MPNLDKLQDDEIRFAYDNQYQVVYDPMYQAYNNAFFKSMVKGMNINMGFESMTNMDWWEKYLLNMFQFSSAKNAFEMEYLRQNVFDENGRKRDYEDYYDLVKDKINIVNDVWMRVEYDLCGYSANMANAWRDIWENRDLYPYAIYKTREDGKVRPEHAVLDNIKFRLDGIGNKLFAPNGWNCRCFIETTDDNENVLSEKQVKSFLEGKTNVSTNPLMPRYVDNVPENFRYNVGIDGIFPKNGVNYFDVLKNANDANQSFYQKTAFSSEPLNSTVYTLSAMNLAAKQWSDSQDNVHDNQDVIFKNDKFKLKVRLTIETFNKLVRKSRGFENIKYTIEKPDEIYMRWVDPEDQNSVLTNYMKHDGKYAYIVEVRDGKIIDAHFKTHNDAKNMRKQGVKLII